METCFNFDPCIQLLLVDEYSVVLARLRTGPCGNGRAPHLYSSIRSNWMHRLKPKHISLYSLPWAVGAYPAPRRLTFSHRSYERSAGGRWLVDVVMRSSPPVVGNGWWIISPCTSWYLKWLNLGFGEVGVKVRVGIRVWVRAKIK